MVWKLYFIVLVLRSEDDLAVITVFLCTVFSRVFVWFFCAVFSLLLCDSAKITRKLRGQEKAKWKEISWICSMCHPVWFCKRLRFYTVIRLGVLCLVSVTCRSKGKTARKDLLINFMVVTLLIEGGILVLMAINLGEKKRCWPFIGSVSGLALLSSCLMCTPL